MLNMRSKFPMALFCAASIGCCALYTAAAVGAPAKRGATKSAAGKTAPANKATPAEMLLGSIRLNHWADSKLAPARCKPVYFRSLAYALYLNKDWLTREKGEFETTEAYEKGLNGLEDAFSNVGSISTCWPLSSDHIDFKYNADKAGFEGSTITAAPTVDMESKDLGPVRGITNGGVRFTYDRDTEIYFKIGYEAGGLEFPARCRYTPRLYDREFGGFEFKFPYEASKAAALKYGGFLVIESRLVRPFIGYDRDTHTASLTERYQSLEETLRVKAKPLKVSIIDASGSEVWSCSPGSSA